MKHLILTLIAAMAAGVCLADTPVQFANSGNRLTIKSDNKTINIAVDSTASGSAMATIVINNDTLMKTDVNSIADRLNDTLVASSLFYQSDNEGMEYDEYDMRELELRHRNQAESRGQMTAIIIVAIVFGTILLIIVACLMIYYMNRRNRLNVVEKAIENNYQLPDSFYTGKQNKPCNTADDNIAAADLSQQSKVQQVLSCVSDREMKQAVNLTIVGFGLVLFFSLMGLDVLAALSTIPLLIGISRILIPYLTRRRIPTPPQHTATQNQEPPVFNHNENQQPDKAE